jgi:uncharacterized protein
MQSIRISISENIGEVSVEVVEADRMKAFVVLAHGAGAGMHHSFMIRLSDALKENGIGSLRYQFPYMEQGKKRPDVPAVATKTVECVLIKAHELYPSLPLIAAGKSFGGRMTSQCLTKNALTFVKGVIFYGFPLHPAGEPATNRADHLKEMNIPMLFLQGTRDALAELALIQAVCSKLPTASLELLEGADHSFKKGKKEFIAELSEASVKWIAGLE